MKTAGLRFNKLVNYYGKACKYIPNYITLDERDHLYANIENK